MAFVTKVWKDRLVEFAGRRKLKDVKTGVETTVDVSRMEGAVSLAGDAFSAVNMNNLEQRIKNEFDSVNQSLNGNVLIAEGSGANTKYYIQKGADTASKKLLGDLISIYKVLPTLYTQTEGGINISSLYANYKNITQNNISLYMADAYWENPISNNMAVFTGISYTPSTGLINFSVDKKVGYLVVLVIINTK